MDAVPSAAIIPLEVSADNGVRLKRGRFNAVLLSKNQRRKTTWEKSF